MNDLETSRKVVTIVDEVQQVVDNESSWSVVQRSGRVSPSKLAIHVDVEKSDGSGAISPSRFQLLSNTAEGEEEEEEGKIPQSEEEGQVTEAEVSNQHTHVKVKTDRGGSRRRKMPKKMLVTRQLCCTETDTGTRNRDSTWTENGKI